MEAKWKVIILNNWMRTFKHISLTFIYLRIYRVCILYLRIILSFNDVEKCDVK